MEAVRGFKARMRRKLSWQLMIKVMSNDDVDNFKLNNDEFDKQKKLTKKKRKGIQKRKVIDTLCESNIY